MREVPPSVGPCCREGFFIDLIICAVFLIIFLYKGGYSSFSANEIIKLVDPESQGCGYGTFGSPDLKSGAMVKEDDIRSIETSSRRQLF